VNRPEPESPEAERRSESAADWLVRRDRGLTPAEQDQFLEWLAADPRHGDWLELHRRTIGDFSGLAQWRPEHSNEPNPDLLAPPRRRRLYWLAPTVLAAAAAVALVFAWPRSAPTSPEAAAVVNVELERRLLEDGSSVELNRGADVQVVFTPTERRVTLANGEAYFTVAKNPDRPFIVRAGGIDVRAVGTAFSVRLDTGAVEVLVTEGRVGVHPDTPKTAPIPNPASGLGPGTLVDAGQRATVSLTTAEAPRVTPATPAQINRHLSWQPQLLNFSSAPLGLAVAEFNRRNPLQFILEDADLAAMPIVASIRSDNVEGFARFLSAAPGVQIERRGANEIVVRRKR
jgi:transmembrane sensor